MTLDIRSFLDILVSEDGVLTGAPSLEIVNGSLFIDYVILEEEERMRNINVPKQMHIINRYGRYQF